MRLRWKPACKLLVYAMFLVAAAGCTHSSSDKGFSAKGTNENRQAAAPTNETRNAATRLSLSDSQLNLVAADVRWVYMSWPIPSQFVSDPLIGGRDEERIAELLSWIDEAKPVDDTGMTSPLDGRSMAVNIELHDKRIIEVRPAWTCESKKDEDGNRHVSCKPVPNNVYVTGIGKDAYFANSEQLFTFVNKGYLAWMPNVKPFEAPSQVKRGVPFSISGHGARTDTVTIQLLMGNKVIWHQQTIVKDGEWKTEGTVPEDVRAGEYMWSINNGTTKFGVSLHIS